MRPRGGRRWRGLILALLAVATPLPAASRPAPLIYYAVQPDALALDAGEGGGNPFASALVTLLGDASLTLGALPAALAALTAQRSDGFQQVDGPVSPAPAALPLVAQRGRRIALVLVESQYAGTGLPPLPGAARDAARVAKALAGAGFAVTVSLDASRPAFDAALAAFSRRSRNADVALIYATGHGFATDGITRVAVPDDRALLGPADLPGHGVAIPAIAARLRARTANLLFWAGCRTAF